jgi:hypothetical protein
MSFLKQLQLDWVSSQNKNTEENTMVKQSISEWLNEAVSKFGKCPDNWTFKCPACGKVSTVKDFKDAGADINDSYQECIGRHTGKGSPSKDSKDGCNWAAYGLFGTLDKGRIVISEEGNEINVFDFA